MTAQDTDGLVAEWRKAMEGVKPGQWLWRGKDGGLYQEGEAPYAYGDPVLIPVYEYDSGVDTLVSEPDAAWIARCSPAGISALLGALTAKARELAEARARDDATSYEFVAGWHDRQAKLFREMADDEPRTAEPTRKRAAEAAIHHAASAAALRNRAIDERRARTVLSREKEA